MAKAEHRNATMPATNCVGGVCMAPGANVGTNAHLSIGSISQNGTLAANSMTANNNIVHVNHNGQTHSYRLDHHAKTNNNVGGVDFTGNVGTNAHVHIGSVSDNGQQVANSVSDNNNVVHVMGANGQQTRQFAVTPASMLQNLIVCNMQELMDEGVDRHIFNCNPAPVAMMI